MEYSRWSLYDKVLIVVKDSEKIDTCPKAYIVDPKDKKQLEAAKNWASRFMGHEKDKDGNNVAVWSEPKVIETDNSGFELELLETAHSSSQGGKQSFWNCRISKYKSQWKVGINSDLLLLALKQGEFINGKSSSTYSFARCSGGLGLINKDMAEYSLAVADMQTKKELSRGKTSKWKIGRNYHTLTMDYIYLGEVYTPITFDFEIERNTQTLKVLSTPNKKILLGINPTEVNETGLKELLDRLTESTIADIKGASVNEYMASRILRGLPIRYNIGDKMVSRKQGDVDLGFYDSYISDLDEALKQIKKEFITSSVIPYGASYSLQYLMCGANPGIDKYDIEILKIIIQRYREHNRKVIIMDDALKKMLE